MIHCCRGYNHFRYTVVVIVSSSFTNIKTYILRFFTSICKIMQQIFYLLFSFSQLILYHRTEFWKSVALIWMNGWSQLKKTTSGWDRRGMDWERGGLSYKPPWKIKKLRWGTFLNRVFGQESKAKITKEKISDIWHTITIYSHIQHDLENFVVWSSSKAWSHLHAFVIN